MVISKIKKCPCCNSNATYKETTKSDGYCSYKVGYISCDNPLCRISTPTFIVDGYYDATTTKEDAFKVWNNRIVKEERND